MDFFSSLRKYYDFKKIVETNIKGKFADDFMALTGRYGVEVKKTDCDPLTIVRLDWIEIKVAADIDKDVQIITGCDVTTKCVSLTCGINRIEVNAEDKERVAVLIEFCGEMIDRG